jgi:type I restriction-modification system DNA methylase subunit
MLSNPPFGVDWKKIEADIKDEHTLKGFDGRFGTGLPRVSDGSLLFLLHLISKLRDTKDGGARIGIILNGSPLFTGGAGSGESEIRRTIIYWKRLSPCRPICSTTQAFRLTFGFYPTKKRVNAKATFSSLTR